MSAVLLVPLIEAWTLCDNEAYGSSLCDGTLFAPSTLSASLNPSNCDGTFHIALTQDSHAVSQHSQCL